MRGQRERKAILALSSVLCLLSSVPVFAAPPLLLAELQKSLAGTTNVQSEFIQEKNLALLQQTVIIKGRLAVQHPDRLSWQVTEPLRYNLTLDGSQLKQWDEETGKVQTKALAGNPVFKVVVTQLRAWFSGQFEVLGKDFESVADLAGGAPTIVFTPRPGSFASPVIKRVVLTFREDRRYLREMLIEERSGDRTTMTFTNTVLNAAIPDTAWEVKPHER